MHSVQITGAPIIYTFISQEQYIGYNNWGISRCLEQTLSPPERRSGMEILLYYLNSINDNWKVFELIVALLCLS